jgi:DNA integrity scanning protein DisA with diadenylate cyclase activity
MRIGAMIILADELPSGVSLVGGEDFEQLILENLSRDIEAADLARVDGAMQINSAGAVVRCGAFVRRKLSTTVEPEQLGAAGSRHRAALDLSAVATDALVFVVSENRPMSVFRKGNRILDGV